MIDTSIAIGKTCVIPIDPANGEPLILQTWYRDDPWRVCVSALLLVATQRVQVERLLADFFVEYPQPDDLLTARYVDLAVFVSSLGLGHQRAGRLRGFTEDFTAGVPVGECYGVGPYVYDSYRLVHLRQRNVRPDDTILGIYADWLARQPVYEPIPRLHW